MPQHLPHGAPNSNPNSIPQSLPPYLVCLESGHRQLGSDPNTCNWQLGSDPNTCIQRQPNPTLALTPHRAGLSRLIQIPTLPTLKVVPDEKEDGSIKFNAASPDDGALVKVCCNLSM